MFYRKLMNALVFSVVFVGSIGALQAQEASWNAYTYIPSAEITAGQLIERITEEINEEAGDNLQVRLNFGGSLPIDAQNITQAVSQGGTVQIADDGFPYGNIPIAGILNLPMLLTNEDDFATAVEIMMPHIKDAFAERGVTLLAVYNYPQQVIWSSEEVTSLADLEGSRMRVSSPQQAAFVEEYGGTPVTIGTPEVASALQRGVVDGVFTASSGGGRTWEDLLNSTYRLGPNYFASFLIANHDAFNELDAETQETIRSIAVEQGEWATKQMREEEQEVTEAMASRGMTVTEARSQDIEEGAERMAPYWEEWAADQGPETEEVLGEIREAIDR